jgi:ribosomal protein L32
MSGKFLLFGRDETENSLMHFVDRKISEQRRNERRYAEQRTTKHRVQARNSCIADARSYRVARRFPLLAIAQFDWKALIPTHRTCLFGISWLKKLRNDQLKHWLTAKQASQ